MNIALTFLIGLTAGGLSCAAVQGGLLMSSMAQQAQRDVKNRASLSLMPVSVFLLAKIVAYTLLGLLLGWLGSMFQLSPVLQGVLLLGVAIFMLGNALNLFEIHPFFRKFVIEEPESARRLIRQQVKQGGHAWYSPALLGALTVLIPCGITQVVMAAALSTGSAWHGAALMFAFTLGTSPLFFALVVLAHTLGAKKHERFIGAMAIVMLILGVTTLDNGLSLLGSPVTLGSLTKSDGLNAYLNPSVLSGENTATGVSSSTPAAAISEAEVRVIKMEISKGAYQPSVINAPANTPLKLEIKADSGYT